MPAYQPGRGINKDSLERLKNRKEADAAIAVPAEDNNQQWDRLLGEGAKKKLRCGVCTRPLSALEQEAKQLVCSSCMAKEAAEAAAEEAAEAAEAGAPAVAALERDVFRGQELSTALYYYCRSRLPAPPAQPAKPVASEPKPPPQEEAEAPKKSAPSVAMKSASGDHIATLARGAAVYSGKLVPAGQVGIAVLSFNLLAECYVRVEGQPWNAFDHCADEDLAWERRLPKIVRLLNDSLADVICLQEVVLEQRALQAGGAEEWRLPAWTDKLEGYVGVLQGLKQKEWEKTSERNLRVTGHKAPTGVATFYRKDRLKESTAAKSGSGSGLVVFLTCTDASSGQALEVAVGNVHLVGDPSKVEEHTKALNSLTKNFGRSQHRVICGDFNGECEAGSGVAAWALEEGFWDAPTGTSWAEPGKAMRLDHVLHSPGLHVQAATASLPPDEVASGLPCAACPSDHQPVAALLSAPVRGKCPW